MRSAFLLTMTLATIFGSLASTGLRAEDSAPKSSAGEWNQLFDGKTLDGWRCYNKEGTGSWGIKDGAIYLEKPGSGDLMTTKKYGDFELSLEWKFEEGNNSGIIYRVVETKGPSYETGIEMQVMSQKPGDKLGKNSGGSLYDMYAPSSNPFRADQEWVAYRVVCRGNHLEQWVNGEKVVDCDIGSDDWNSRYAASKWKDKKDYAAAKEGYIALQDHGGKILYRNIKLKELK